MQSDNSVVEISEQGVAALKAIVDSDGIQQALEALADEISCKPLWGEYYEQCNRLFRQHSDQQQHMLSWAVDKARKIAVGQDRMDVLSIGCGCGIFDLPFLHQMIKEREGTHFNYVGVDINGEQVEHLRTALNKIDSGTDAFEYQVDCEDIADWKSNQQFDCILLVHSLYYIPNPESVLDKARSLLRPGGKIIIFSAENDGINLAAEKFSHSGGVLTDKNHFVFRDTIDRYLLRRQMIADQECLNAVFDATSIFMSGEDDKIRLLSFLVQADLRNALNTEAISVFRRWLKSIPALNSTSEYAVHHPVWAYQFG